MPKSKPSKKRIQEEIKKLSEMLPKVKKYSIFGDNNREAIEAQIGVLKENLSEEDIAQSYGDVDYQYGCALNARNWLNGNFDYETLSENWRPIITKEN
jgi:hypothetical protein